MQNKGFIIGTAAFLLVELTNLPASRLIYKLISRHFESFLMVESSYGKVIVHVAYHLNVPYSFDIQPGLLAIYNPWSASRSPGKPVSVKCNCSIVPAW